ncbi:MAG: efflux RND transporter permease subunit, partial [Sphingomonas sp.]|nr:efflux RND transporter permease subunit [Sphingomonas sp.]
MRMGKSAYQASLDAADEIGLAVLATTMAIVAVFLPVALMPGISGQFFKAFGFTVVVSVMMSLLVARMITPLMAAYFLRSKGVQPHANFKWMDWYLQTLNWSLDTTKAHAYRLTHPGFWGKIKSLFRDHRVYMVGAGLGAFLLSILMFATLSMTFQPPLNRDFSAVTIGLPPGATLEQTEAITDKVAAIVSKDPNVERVFERIRIGSARIPIVLKKDRKVTSTEFERNLAPTLAAIPDARVNFQSQGGGGPDGGGRDITLYLGGDDPEKLTATANRIAKEMQGIQGLRAPRVGGDLVRPEILIKPRFDLAADLGVTTAALSQTIRIATIGDIEQNSAKFSVADRQVPITVALSEYARRDLSTLENLPVPTSSGGSVPLKSVASIGFGSGPTTIQRTDQIRRIAVGADLAPGLVSGDVWPKINELPTLKNLPLGVTKLNLGDQKWQGQLIYYFLLALGAGILLVFAVLVLLYRRFLSPFVNMGSLLLAPLGAAIALHVAGQPVSLPVLIGLLMLFGIVAKNSILLVDFAVEMINHGMSKNEAIYEAGHKRAQPIVMTTVAMVAGMLPIALSLNGDGSWRAPMGVTVIGGLIFSTILTLLLVPAYFSIAISIEARIGRLFHRFIGDDAQRQPDPVPAE